MAIKRRNHGLRREGKGTKMLDQASQTLRTEDYEQGEGYEN